jgi:hypothetical protein
MSTEDIIKQRLREYLASEESKFRVSTTGSFFTREQIQRHIEAIFSGHPVRVEVTPGWEENTFDVAIYPDPPVEFISVEFTVESKDEVSNPIEEQHHDLHYGYSNTLTSCTSRTPLPIKNVRL